MCLTPVANTACVCVGSGETWGEQGYLLLGRGMQYDGIIHGQCDVLGLGLYPTLLK